MLTVKYLMGKLIFFFFSLTVRCKKCFISFPAHFLRVSFLSICNHSNNRCKKLFFFLTGQRKCKLMHLPPPLSKTDEEIKSRQNNLFNMW